MAPPREATRCLWDPWAIATEIDRVVRILPRTCHEGMDDDYGMEGSGILAEGQQMKRQSQVLNPTNGK